MNIKFKGLLIVLVVMLLISTGCSNKKEVIIDDNNDGDKEDVKIIADEDPTSLDGLAKSPLTGLWIDQEIATRRPVAVMINNIRTALPQSGISDADIIYETLAEGEITRLVGLFQSLESEKIGPIRSIRDYYFNIAFDHDAIIVHHGGSPQAFEAIRILRPPSLNTLSGLETIMTWRDSTRKNQRGMLEHSLYTSGERILAGWSSVGYRTEKAEIEKSVLNFAIEEITPVGEKVLEVTLPFSRTYISEFVYDKESREYKKRHHKNPHIDENNNKQLRFKNIIIQSTDISLIPGDNEGRRNIRLIGEGNGVYITNGKSTEITWSKSDAKSPTVFRDMNGKELEVNKGKTYIGIFPNNRQIEINSIGGYNGL